MIAGLFKRGKILPKKTMTTQATSAIKAHLINRPLYQLTLNQAQIRMLALNGIVPSAETVESGRFPLSRPLIFVTSDQPTREVEHFIRFAQSNDVADLVRELSYVPISN